MFDPQEVTGAHFSADARQESTASAETASNNPLGEPLPSLVSARYVQYKAFVSSRLTTLFHMSSNACSPVLIDATENVRVYLKMHVIAGECQSVGRN